MVDRSRKHRWRARILHGLRVALVAALLVAIPSPKSMQQDGGEPPTIRQLRDANLDVASEWTLGDRSATSGMWQLSDSQGQFVGWVARTLPAASDVVGYRGPTEAVILLDPALVISSVGLLGSDDTPEHVAAVRRDPRFLQQFRGWTWGEVANDFRVDGVSGATLTSLALAEGVIRRMGGSRPSLVFPDPLTVDEVRDWFPDAVAVDDSSGEVADEQNQLLGRVIRTGRYSDDLIGYQGPTELLLHTGDDGTIKAIRIRHSLDNEPYVDYVRTEAGFWKRFVGMNLDELAAFDPQQEGVEGVSGATMTSQTIADTLVTGARGHLDEVERREASTQPWISSIQWSRADMITIAILALAGWLSHFGWFRIGWLRRFWLVAVVVCIGLWTGNLVSLSLIAGWSAEGIAWRLAPGLAAIVVVAMAFPPLTKANPYCNHLCPHGALQQLIKPSRASRRRLSLPSLASRWIGRVPGFTLAIAYLAVLLFPTIDLSTWEPFHAYLFRIASWGSLAFAIGTLIASAMIPMAYCRLGCPTGRWIDYIRFSAASGRVQVGDWVAIALLVIACAQRIL